MRLKGTFRVLAAALAFSAMASANAATIQLRAWLNGAQEVPPVATAATGSATVTYDTVTRQLSWNVNHRPLIGWEALNASHSHIHHSCRCKHGKLCTTAADATRDPRGVRPEHGD
ncbi:MAG: hypothetical protein DMG51_02930 [Acidobacteria bacterium]|nr:MAG: hypothetical protein DMG51_02930 [Acidobacteriota bacterium]